MRWVEGNWVAFDRSTLCGRSLLSFAVLPQIGRWKRGRNFSRRVAQEIGIQTSADDGNRVRIPYLSPSPSLLFFLHFSSLPSSCISSHLSSLPPPLFPSSFPFLRFARLHRVFNSLSSNNSIDDGSLEPDAIPKFIEEAQKSSRLFRADVPAAVEASTEGDRLRFSPFKSFLFQKGELLFVFLNYNRIRQL